MKPTGGAGQFTPWLTPNQLNQYIHILNQGHEVSFWDRGHWITAVEGRMQSGVHQYRIIYAVAPRSSQFQWRYRVAQSGEDFRKNLDSHRQLGFELVHSHVFVDTDNIRRYQAVWHKIN